MDCDLGDIRINYEEYGSGFPLVFIHGWTVDHRFEVHDYEPILSARAGWRRIYIDLPGHGATPAASWISSMDDMLDVAVRFIETYLHGAHFALAGTSAGGYLAQGVIRRLPHRVDGLLLRVPLVEPDLARVDLPEPVVLVERPDLSAAVSSEEASGFALAVVQSEAFLAKLRTDSIPARRLANVAFLDSIREGPRGFSYSGGLERPSEPFQAPALILVGRQDHIVGYRNAWSILEDYPRATFAALDREGHILPVEQQHLFAALVSNWLDRVEEYRAARSARLGPPLASPAA